MTIRAVLASCLLLACVLSVEPARAVDGSVLAVPEADRARTDLVTLVVPVTLDVRMVDGIDYPGLRAMFRKGDSTIRVLPGEREIAVQYSELFQVDADNHEVVKSKLIVLRFSAAAGQTYRVEHDRFRTADAARKGVKNFVVRVVDAAGVNRVVAAGQVQKNWQGESTTTTRPDLVGSIAPAAASIPPAGSTAPVAAAAASAVAPPAMPAAPAAGAIRSIDLLRFAWQGATAAERAEFLQWARENP